MGGCKFSKFVTNKSRWPNWNKYFCSATRTSLRLGLYHIIAKDNAIFAKLVYNAIDRWRRADKATNKQYCCFRLRYRTTIFFFFLNKNAWEPSSDTNLHRHQCRCHCNHKYRLQPCTNTMHMCHIIHNCHRHSSGLLSTKISSQFAHLCLEIAIAIAIVIVDCRLSIVDCRLSIVDCRLSIVDCRLSIVDCQWHFSKNLYILFI